MGTSGRQMSLVQKTILNIFESLHENDTYSDIHTRHERMEFLLF